MFAVTGANGQLGRLVIDALLQTTPAARIVAAVRDPAKAEDLAAKGVAVRQADYDRPETLNAAFQGAERVLLISSNAVGRRVEQHRAVIDAAQEAGARMLAYTSALHADRSALGLAEEHRRTEALAAASPLRTAILRNGWYSENYVGRIQAAVESGVLVGAAGDGRIASATRADYAAAAAAVLTADHESDAVYELAGDEAWTLAELAEEAARQSGRPVAYEPLSEPAYRQTLLAAGLPAFVADILSNSDAAAAGGALFDDSRTLSRLIGRPTTAISETVAAALRR